MRSKDAILRWWQNFFSAAEYFDQSGRIILKGVACTTEQLRLQSVCSWKEGTLHGVKYRQNGGAVLLVNVFVKLSSPAPTRDRALIVYRLLVRLRL